MIQQKRGFGVGCKINKKNLVEEKVKEKKETLDLVKEKAKKLISDDIDTEKLKEMIKKLNS